MPVVIARLPVRVKICSSNAHSQSHKPSPRSRAPQSLHQSEQKAIPPHSILKWLAHASRSAWLCPARSAQSQDEAEAARQAKLRKQQSSLGSTTLTAKSKTCINETPQQTVSARDPYCHNRHISLTLSLLFRPNFCILSTEKHACSLAGVWEDGPIQSSLRQ